MSNKNPPLVKRVKELLDTTNSLEEKIEELRREIWEWKGKALIEKATKIGDYLVVTYVESWDMKDAQAFAVDFVKRNPKTILLLASEKYVVFARNENVPVSMRELFRKVASELGGKGGGTDNLARGKVDAKPETILSVALEKVKETLQLD